MIRYTFACPHSFVTLRPAASEAPDRGAWIKADEHAAEVERLRANNKALNLRAQQAEGIIARAGLVENRPQTGKGRSFGRMLANYAAAMYERRHVEFVAKIERIIRESSSPATALACILLECRRETGRAG